MATLLVLLKNEKPLVNSSLCLVYCFSFFAMTIADILLERIMVWSLWSLLLYANKLLFLGCCICCIMVASWTPIPKHGLVISAWGCNHRNIKGTGTRNFDTIQEILEKERSWCPFKWGCDWKCSRLTVAVNLLSSSYDPFVGTIQTRNKKLSPVLESWFSNLQLLLAATVHNKAQKVAFCQQSIRVFTEANVELQQHWPPCTRECLR